MSYSSTLIEPNLAVTQQPPKSDELRTRVTQYCCQLIRMGIPKSDAWEVAVAIAKYDDRNRIPKPDQQQLIRQYCSSICRAKLWRADLLLESRI